MIIHSLIWKDDSQKVFLEDFVLSNLNLIQLLPENFKEYLCMDISTLYYRQEILEDFKNTPDLLHQFEQNLNEIYEIDDLLNNVGGSRGTIFTDLDYLVLMEKIISCVEALSDILEDHCISSEGLNLLKSSLCALKIAPQFVSLKKDSSALRHELNHIKSIDLIFKVHLNSIPIEAYMTQTHQEAYEEPLFLKHTNHILKNPNPYFDQIFPGADGLHLVNGNNLIVLKEVEYALKGHTKKIKAFSKKYADFEIKSFYLLKEELAFYRLGYQMMLELSTHGLPCCLPHIVQKDDLRLSFQKGYAINLAYHMFTTPTYNPSQMVLNDFSFDQGQIYILTGANRGGKTTFTQTLGQIQLLSQLGFYVPCEEATISPVDHILTHFPVTEQNTIDLGRFGEECRRFSDLFSKLTTSSLLLMNESFSGTSHLESLVIAEESIKALKYKKVRTLFNTHLHELGMNVASYNLEQDNGFTVVSLCAQADEGNRSYKIQLGVPVGTSYAHEIAEKYEATYDQLLGKLKKRGETNV